MNTLTAITGSLFLMAIMLLAQAEDPTPPVWPGRLHLLATQDKDGDLGVVDLWYDYEGGRNLNVIQTQSGEEDGPLYDNEWANGTTYYYLPAKGKAKYCNIIDFGVGLLKPDWLSGADYLGEETVGMYDCYKWEQGDTPEAAWKLLGGLRQPTGPMIGSDTHKMPSLTLPSSDKRFITYWSEKDTGRPVYWRFFDGAEFQVIRYDPGATMDDDLFQLPEYCFEEDSTSVISEA